MAVAQRSGFFSVRTVGVVFASVLALASCSSDVDRRGADDPLAEHFEEALEIASEEWETSWMLDQVSSRFELDGDVLIREDIAYLFVSDSSSYYLVRFHSDGTVSSLPVAGMARLSIEAFDFANNEIVSDEAVDAAWDTFGEALVERCGPLRWLDVNGIIGSEGRQMWSVSYRIGGDEHTIWLDAASGDVVEIDEEPC